MLGTPRLQALPNPCTLPPIPASAEDIDFKYPLHRACTVEISIFCKDVPHGHARVVRCLQVRRWPAPAAACLPLGGVLRAGWGVGVR